MNWINLIEIQGLIILFAAIYRFGLSQHGCFKFNRWYLLLTPFVAIGISLIEIKSNPQIAAINLAEFAVSQEITGLQNNIESQHFNPLFLYLPISLVILMVITFQLVKIYHKSTPISGYPIPTRLNTNLPGPFTIFTTLYTPTAQVNNEIIAHESVHIRDKHYVDLILLHIAALVFWINPASWLLIKFAKLNHEFLADQKVIRGEIDGVKYKESLLQQVLNTRVPMVSHGFLNLNELKTRIKMMNTKNHKKQAWKTLYWTIPAILLVVIACNQKPAIEESIPVLDIAEEMPKFEGGDQALFKFLSENIAYPKEAVKDSVQGVVFVSFVVDEKGQVTEPTILKGIHPRLDEEALNIIEKMPDWTPGKDKGAPVKVKYNLPIKFVLE
ncbi:M56 family metallopeptidase [Luteibaculum oceani]|uniref:TonB family protein n=1 Tax=Luteibaculum oceani TaxID=1294296 RepID=A0A5C6V1R2_9FLAO|nr:M56 family metallopeptidase [Luteibaculum oceani]TXC78621.1 TonB family protein [Luteibaculum oceani]